MNSKVILLLAVVGVMTISKVVAECATSDLVECTTKYAPVAGDEENCSKIKSLVTCAKTADCLDDDKQALYDGYSKTYKCGAGSLSVSLMFILTTVFITVKNIL